MQTLNYTLAIRLESKKDADRLNQNARKKGWRNKGELVRALAGNEPLIPKNPLK